MLLLHHTGPTGASAAPTCPGCCSAAAETLWPASAGRPAHCQQLLPCLYPGYCCCLLQGLQAPEQSLHLPASPESCTVVISRDRWAFRLLAVYSKACKLCNLCVRHQPHDPCGPAGHTCCFGCKWLARVLPKAGTSHPQAVHHEYALAEVTVITPHLSTCVSSSFSPLISVTRTCALAGSSQIDSLLASCCREASRALVPDTSASCTA